ncbi:MAG: T9SS type A sorting domain-containing protein, partial [Candidatus Cloacimonetes bacterium]|nr:T9SS type A sorting domain-containing protein [Candidatus Cloacimonadota bacterium]
YENTREYTPLESDLIDEDFIGIRLGDVSGNWAPDVRMPLTQKSSPPGADPSEEATEIEASNNSTLRIPVVIDEVNAIEGIDIIIAFSPEVLKLTGLSLNEGILEDNNYGVETNLEEVGQGIMVIYAQKDLVSETGIVAFIEFDIIGIEGSKSEIYFTKFDVNETDASGGFNLIDSESNEIITRRLEVNVVQPLPDKFALYPNYPNPFRNHTTISYALPEATNVKIQIYNIRGQLVTELVNGFETAGRKKIVWNTEGYANGIYFCNISTEKNNEKIKLLLLR